MSTELLKAVPNVEIDPEGTFKYVLIRVYAPQTPDGGEPSKLIVRGNIRGAYHGKVINIGDYYMRRSVLFGESGNGPSAQVVGSFHVSSTTP